MKKSALYICLKCNASWWAGPGPTECKACGHLYCRRIDELKPNERRERLRGGK